YAFISGPVYYLTIRLPNIQNKIALTLRRWPGVPGDPPLGTRDGKGTCCRRLLIRPAYQLPSCLRARGAINRLLRADWIARSSSNRWVQIDNRRSCRSFRPIDE